MFVGCVFRDLRSAHLFTWRMLMMCGRGAVRSARTTPNIASSKTALPIVSAYFWPVAVSLIQFFKKTFFYRTGAEGFFAGTRNKRGLWACGMPIFSEAEVAEWAALYLGRLNGRPTPDQLQKMKELKEQRHAMRLRMTQKLGGDWTERSVEKALDRLSEAAKGVKPEVAATVNSGEPSTKGQRLLSVNGPISGREKYLGGSLGRDGYIYCIPGHAIRVLRIDTATDDCEFVGPEFAGQYKWLRSVCTHPTCARRTHAHGATGRDGRWRDLRSVMD